MNLSSLLDHSLESFLQLPKRCRFLNTNLCSPFFEKRLRSHPNDIFHGHIITKKNVLLLIYIDNAGQTVRIESEEIEKRTILPEMIRICRIIHRGFVVP